MDSLVIMVLIKILRKFKELKESNHMNSSVCVLVGMCVELCFTYGVWLLLGLLQSVRAAQVTSRLAAHHVTVPRWRSNRRKPRHLII